MIKTIISEREEGHRGGSDLCRVPGGRPCCGTLSLFRGCVTGSDLALCVAQLLRASAAQTDS